MYLPPNQYEDSPGGGPSKKLKRLKGSCDNCKRKKIRCDSATKPGGKCSCCISAGFDCTHVELGKNLGPAKNYVENIEAQLQRMENLLKRLLPGVDIQQKLDEDLAGIDQPVVQRNDDDQAIEDLTRNTSLLQVDLDSNTRFLGKSSGQFLIQTALQVKRQYYGSLPSEHNFRRPECWVEQEWQRDPQTQKPQNYIYPNKELMLNLCALFFTHLNTFLPLLHRPTFEKAILEDQHISDPYFGGVALLVCALGARYSSDPCVLIDPSLPNSAGWMWFEQVEVIRPVTDKPTLYDLQLYALSVMYKPTVYMLNSVWIDVGFGLRLASDIGAHRRRRKDSPTSQDELWKRAFWVLHLINREMSAFLGRPSSMTEEDYDLDYPVDCDDEYWDHPDPACNFKQPVGRPSKITYFILCLELAKIQEHAMRKIYYAKTPDNLLRHSLHQSELDTISEIDSAMTVWLDSVPQHLQWDPKIQGVFLLQSVHLYVNYHQLRIFLHRPFIPTPRVSSSMSFRSLAICTNAARSCIDIARSISRIPGTHPMRQLHAGVCFAGVILLLNSWSKSRAELSEMGRRDLESVQVCLDILKLNEARVGSGRLWDCLNELASSNSDRQVPERAQPKRARTQNAYQDDTVYSNQAQLPINTNTSASQVGAPSQAPQYAFHAGASQMQQMNVYEMHPTPISAESGQAFNFGANGYRGAAYTTSPATFDHSGYDRYSASPSSDFGQLPHANGYNTPLEYTQQELSALFDPVWSSVTAPVPQADDWGTFIQNLRAIRG